MYIKKRGKIMNIQQQKVKNTKQRAWLFEFLINILLFPLNSYKRAKDNLFLCIRKRTVCAPTWSPSRSPMRGGGIYHKSSPPATPTLALQMSGWSIPRQAPSKPLRHPTTVPGPLSAPGEPAAPSPAQPEGECSWTCQVKQSEGFPKDFALAQEQMVFSFSA